MMSYQREQALLCVWGAVSVLLFMGSTGAIAGPPLLNDGQILKAVDGLLTDPTGEAKRWYFTLRADLTLGQRVLPAGTRYELLPCHALESLVLDSQQRTQSTYRLWARVTQYRARNYLYPKRFVALIGQRTANTPSPSIPSTEPNRPHALGIPADILSQMDSEGSSAEWAGSRMPIKADTLVLGRRAYGKSVGEVTYLILTGMGQNPAQEPIRLLPCRIRDRIENLQSRHADPLMLRIAGVQTQFMGQRYILLHQAVQLYGYGNLGNQ